MWIFKPHKEGLRQVLGELETVIMEAMWNRGQASVREIANDLKPYRQLAYTTVKTVMGRLVKKGYLIKDAAERAHLYRPAQPREQFWQRVKGEVLNGLLDGDELALVHFVNAVGARDLHQLDRLQELIEAKRRELIRASQGGPHSGAGADAGG